MEAIVTPRTSSDFPSDFREAFARFRSPEGERMVLEQNLFIEAVLPSRIQRQLSDEEMDHYRAPFANPGEDRRPPCPGRATFRSTASRPTSSR
jgi:haloalkane dehalogenase